MAGILHCGAGQIKNSFKTMFCTFVVRKIDKSTNFVHLPHPIGQKSDAPN
jgi:hypothetical protein